MHIFLSKTVYVQLILLALYYYISETILKHNTEFLLILKYSRVTGMFLMIVLQNLSLCGASSYNPIFMRVSVS